MAVHAPWRLAVGDEELAVVRHVRVADKRRPAGDPAQQHTGHRVRKIGVAESRIALVVGQAQDQASRRVEHRDLAMPHALGKAKVARAGLLQVLPDHVQGHVRVEDELAVRFQLDVGHVQQRGRLFFHLLDDLLIGTIRRQPLGELLVGDVDEIVAPEFLGHARAVFLCGARCKRRVRRW